MPTETLSWAAKGHILAIARCFWKASMAIKQGSKEAEDLEEKSRANALVA